MTRSFSTRRSAQHEAMVDDDGGEVSAVAGGPKWDSAGRALRATLIGRPPLNRSAGAGSGRERGQERRLPSFGIEGGNEWSAAIDAFLHPDRNLIRTVHLWDKRVAAHSAISWPARA